MVHEKGDPRLPPVGGVVPDAPCHPVASDGGGTRLRELLGERFVALLVLDPRDAAKAAIRASRLSWPAPCDVVLVGHDAPLSGVTVLEDPSGEIRRAYGAAGPAAFLIRPDGHLAAHIGLTRPEAVDSLPSMQARSLGG